MVARLARRGGTAVLRQLGRRHVLNVPEQERDAAYADYLAAVEASRDLSKRNKARSRVHDDERGDLMNQGTAAHDRIVEVLTGVDGALTKLRRLNETVFIIVDTGLDISPTLFHKICVFLTSFHPFPRVFDVGYYRHELVMKLYNHMRSRGTVLTSENVESVLYCLARTGMAQKFGRALLNEALRVLADAKEALITITAEISEKYFRLVKEVGTRADMVKAYREHEELWREVHFRNIPSYYTSLLAGLAQHDMIEEALTVINRWEGMPVTSTLAVATLNVCAKSRDPLATFSMFEVLFARPSTLVPTKEVFSLLLYAAAQNPKGMQADHVVRVVNAMRYHQVRTDDADLLNRLCISLFAVKRNDMAYDLYKSMKARGIDVYPVTTEALPPDMQVEETEEVKILGYNIKSHAPPNNVETARTDGKAVSPADNLSEWHRVPLTDRYADAHLEDDGIKDVWTQEGQAPPPKVTNLRDWTTAQTPPAAAAAAAAATSTSNEKVVRRVELRRAPILSKMTKTDAAAARDTERAQRVTASLKAMPVADAFAEEEPVEADAKKPKKKGKKAADDDGGYDVGMLLGL